MRRVLKQCRVDLVRQGLGSATVAAAMLARLLQRSVVLNLDVDSYRLRNRHVQAEILPKAATVTLSSSAGRHSGAGFLGNRSPCSHPRICADGYRLPRRSELVVARL